MRPRIPSGDIPPGFRELLHELLSLADRDSSRTEVLRRTCVSLLRFSGADTLSFRMEENERITRYRASRDEGGSDRVEVGISREADPAGDAPAGDPIPEPLLQAIRKGNLAAFPQSFTRSRSFWTGDAARPLLIQPADVDDPGGRTVVIGGEYPSLALIKVPVSDNAQGLLFLASRRSDFFSRDDIQMYEVIAETLGVALAHQQAQWALRERIKELTCLYGIAGVASRPGIQLEEFLREIVELLPPGWQYPDITSARIVLDERGYTTRGLRETAFRQSATIAVQNHVRGVVEVFYSEDMPAGDEGPFLKEERKLIDTVAETIGRQVAHHEAQWALRERVKELTCLYGIAQVAARPGVQLDVLLSEIVTLLPPGWQYPEITQSRVTLDGRSFATPGFRESSFRQSAEVIVHGRKRGEVEVVYTKRMPRMYEGPFLREERTLINEIARRVGFVVERWESEQDTARLQEQLRHAERLATIGQLAAGVAHELNEPLAAVLGFAQLVGDSPDLPDQARRDTKRIVDAVLHAREVIRKLMSYTRQMPAQKAKCDLSQLVRDGLFFLESRCAKEGITMVRQLEEGLPEVWADRSQLYQVLVNLVVNGIQAMPQGGRLTISTRTDGGNVRLTVEDTGIGMTPDVQKQLFMPFFTTKDPGQGTGLGLSVVHGIVSAHGGDIRVRSKVAKGSAFEIRIPIDRPLGPARQE